MFIVLTEYWNEVDQRVPVYVTIAHIVTFRRGMGLPATKVELSNGGYVSVVEDPGEIARRCILARVDMQ